MPRRPRALIPPGFYHLTSNAVDDQPLFRDDHDRRSLLSLVAEAVALRGWRILAWCLMTTHYHLLLETRDGDLSAGMQRVNGAFAQRANRRHQRRGHLFSSRFHAEPVEREAHLFAAVRYVVENPVAAALCTAPGDWAWSSHRAAVHGRSDGVVDLARLAELFEGAFGDGGSSTYRRFTERGADPRPVPPPLEDLAARVSARRLVDRFGFEAGCAHAIDDHGYSLRELAADLDCPLSTIYRRLSR